ncbi:MAG: HD domain-containing protein [Bacillota bacterium]
MRTPINALKPKHHWAEKSNLISRLKQVVRLASLLHDVGHAPFSHAGEGAFPNNLEHENYSIAIIKEFFSPIIKSSFPDIRVEEITSLLSKGYLATELVFLGSIISGEMDADKLDYLLRDSYYCGVNYGKYDLERILDTLTVVPIKETEVTDNEIQDTIPGVWQLGIDSDGVQAVEGLIFARYWMFIQVYFHKTSRIYDYFLAKFLKDYLQKEYEGTYPNLEQLESYLRLDDTTILEAINERYENVKPHKETLDRIMLRQQGKQCEVPAPVYGPPRAGDLRSSLLDAGLAKREMGWRPRVTLEDGLKHTAAWFAGRKK